MAAKGGRDMTVNGGDIIVTADVNRRVGTNTATTDSSATSGTTELSIDQVTASLISGRKYTLTWDTQWLGTVAADVFFLILREGSGTGGTQLDFTTVKVGAATITTEAAILMVDYTATATGSQTFTATYRRSSGTGTLTAKASSTQPRTLKVDLAD